MTGNGPGHDERPVDDPGRLYREGATEMPPAHLDARVLHLARESVQRRRIAFSPFAPNWLVPASLTVVLALSASLVFLVELDTSPRQAAPPVTESDAPAARAPARLDALKATRDEAKKDRSGRLEPESALEQRREEAAPASREHAPGTPGRSRAVAPAFELMLETAPASPPAEQRGSRAPALEEAPALEGAPALEKAPAPAAHKEAPRYARPRAASPAAAGTAMPDARLADDAPGTDRDEAAAPVDDTRAWIARIEAMIREGRREEARRELEALLAEHPRAPLPPEVRALLSGPTRPGPTGRTPP